MPKNRPKICTKLPNSGYGYKHRDLALLETWPRYWQKGRAKRRQNSLHVYPRIKQLFVEFRKILNNRATVKLLSILSLAM